MSETQITDLVPQATIDKVKELNTEMQSLLTSYTTTAKELAKGVDVNIKVIGDVDKLEKLFVDKSKVAAEQTSRLNAVIKEQGEVIANTTNTISRQLMEQERVNKTQREAYTEHDRVKKLLDHYHDTYEGQIQSLVKINRELQNNKKAQSENEKALNQGRISLSQYTAAQADLITQQRSLQQEKRTLTQLMTAEEKAMQSGEGSYVEMSQQLELLKKAYKDLGDEGRNSDFGKELETTIQNLDAHLKDMAADMGEFQRNVGNYAIANKDLKKDYEDLVGTLAGLQNAYSKLSEEEKNSEEGQKLAASIAEVSEAAKQTKQTLEEQTKAVEDAKASLGDFPEKTSSVKRDLKELVMEIANLTIEYQNLTDEEKNSAEGRELAEHIAELTERAGKLKDAISDTNQAISNAASDTRGFDQLGGTLQLAIDGFGLATGAAEMFGISSGDLAKIQTKLQAAIAASNAMQKIQNTLQAQSAVMQGVNLAQTKLRTIAENLHTAAKGKGAIATGILTAAQWAFNAAASANPIGLLVVAITAAIAAVYGLVKAFQAFFGPSEEALEQYAKQKQALDDMCEANDRLIDRMKARGATEAELLEQSLLNKQAEKEAADALFARAKELYDDDEDEYKDALEAKKRADEEFEAHKEDSLNYLLKVIHEAEEEEKKQRLGTYEYKRQLIQAELEQQKAIAATLLAQEKITRQVYENLCASLDKAAQLKIDAVNADEQKDNEKKTSSVGGGRSRRTSVGGGSSVRSGRSGGSSAINDPQKAADDLKKQVQAGEDALLKLIEDSLERQRQAEMLSYNRRLKELQEQLSKTKEKEVQLRTALNNQIQGLTAEHNKKMEEIEMSRLERVRKAESEFIASHLAVVKEGSEEEKSWRYKELTNQEQTELLAIQKSENDKTLTHEQAEQMRLNIALKYSDMRTKLEEEYAEKQADIIQKKYGVEEIKSNDAYSKAVNAAKQKYAEELALAKGDAEAQERIRRELDDELFRLDVEYSQKAAESAVKMIEDILKLENLSAEDRLRWEQELTNAKINLANMVADANAASVERQIDDDNRLREKRKANLERWLGVASDTITNIGSLVNALFDGQIQKIEEQQEANTQAGDKEQERITELVNKKVITQEEGEARKRAAEALTAKKNEELEKKKAALQRKQAIFQKATDLAQAGISTALAITNALTTSPFPLGLAMAAIAGAMGAVQIATILATPIPQYAKGTDYHKGGPAIVGDGGRPEVVLFNGGAWLTPDSPTLVDMPKGAVVIPSVNEYGEGLTPVLIPFQGEPNSQVRAYDDSAMLRGVSELARLLRQQLKQQHSDSYNNQFELFKRLI